MNALLTSKFNDTMKAAALATIALTAMIVYVVTGGESDTIFGTFVVSSILLVVKTYIALASYERSLFWGSE